MPVRHSQRKKMDLPAGFESAILRGRNIFEPSERAAEDRLAGEAVQFNAGELALLYKVARTLLEAHEREYGELLATILDATIEALGADRAFVVVRDDGGFRATVARNFRSEALTKAEEEISTSISGAVVEHGHAMLIGDALSSDAFSAHGSVRRLSLRSVLCAPLVASNEAFAIIYLENRQITNAFTERHRNLLDEICRLAAPRLRAAVLVDHARKRAREFDALLGESDGIVTADDEMAALLQTVRQIAPTDLPVLVQGETGTGKELVARAIYHHSTRANSEFWVLNCAAIPATLIESELFGYVRGAFTGANRDRIGIIGAAHRGTLFLDEIGEMPMELQARLLRVLQSGEFTRLGSVRAETVDVRFVAATNRDLEREVEEGRFRSDLYYRLSGITLKVPPLRERPHDIRLLADHFLKLFARGRVPQRFSDDAMEALSQYPFPGNVRELQSEIARLAAVSPPGVAIAAAALNPRILATLEHLPARKDGKLASAEVPPMPLSEMEKRLIISTLQSTRGNRTRAAEILGVSREGLRTKMQRFGLADAAVAQE